MRTEVLKLVLKRIGAPGAAVLLAAAIQSVVILRSPAIGRDGITFINIARKLPQDFWGTLTGADQHPGYPILILASVRIVQTLGLSDSVDLWIHGALIPPFLFGLLTVILVYLLAKRAFDEATAASVAFVFAVFPLFRWSAADAMSDTPHLFFYLAGALFLSEAVESFRLKAFMLCVLLSGFAYLIRPEGLAVAVAAGGFLLAGLRKKETSKRALLYLGGMGACAALVLVPYVLAKGSLTAKKNIFDFFGRIVETISSDPRGALERTFWALNDIGDIFVEDGMRYILFLPFLLGCFAGGIPRAAGSLRAVALVLCSIHVFLLFALFWIAGYTSSRHAMELAAFAMLWVGRGGGVIARRLSRSFSGYGIRFSSRAWLFLLTAFVVVGFLPKSLRGLHPQKAPIVEAARYVGSITEADDLVWSNSPYLPFYAERKGVVAEEEARFDASALGRFACLVFEIKTYGPERWLSLFREAGYREVPVPGVEPGKVRLFLKR